MIYFNYYLDVIMFPILYLMPSPTGRVLPISDSHDSPSCPAGKSSFKMMMMMMSAKLWWN
jgi:hypothetical protein